MKRRIDYAGMSWFEKRRVLRMEKKVQDRKRRADFKAAHPGGGLAWGRILVVIIIIVLAYYFREQIIEFVKGFF